MSVETPHGPAPQVPLLEARSLYKSYWRGRHASNRSQVPALQDVSFTVFPHTVSALVGKSGSGKSTLAKCLTLLEKPDSGEIRFDGIDLSALDRTRLRVFRRHFQLVLQHSATALNPRFSALEAVAEPLRIQKLAGTKLAKEIALDWIERLGLPAPSARRTVLEFSGGQRQRLALARALILQPKLLILDEALAGLDIPTQAAIADLLLDLQTSLPISYIFLTHDLQTAMYLAGTIAVMDNGAIVESGTASDVFARPRRPETRELIDSIPGVASPPPLIGPFR